MAERRKRSAQAAEELFDDLFSSTATEDNGLPRDRDAVMIARDLIEPGPFQTRKYFAPEGLAQLGQSLREVGQQQPIVVRPHPERRGHYQLVAGERRWRASAPEFGDLPMLRATLRDLSDYDVARIVLDENEKREDVSPLARARGLQSLYEVSPGTPSEPEGKPTWDQVAASVGLTKRSALRLVELLGLPEKMQNKLEQLGLSEKHGRALLSLRDHPRAQSALLREIERDDLAGNEALRRAEKAKTASQALAAPNPQPQQELANAAAKIEESPGGSQAKSAESQVGDVLNEQLRPALSFLCEARRRLAEVSPNQEYRRGLLEATAQIEAEARQIIATITQAQG